MTNESDLPGIFDELENDGQEEQQSGTCLEDIRALAYKQLELEGEVNRIEEQLKIAKKELASIQEDQLPAIMKAAGVPEFRLDNGMKVSYKEDLKVSVPKKNKAQVVAFMREWGYAANVKTKFEADLGKGSEETAKELLEVAKQLGVRAAVEEDIATATVKKVLNTRIEEGKSDELSLFGAFQFTKATVK